MTAERSPGSAPHDGAAEADPRLYWEERYAERERIWSDRPNLVLTQVATGLEPGRALDLGCGEGADVIWLAEQGWDALGLDIARTAIERGRREAEARGLGAAAASDRDGGSGGAQHSDIAEHSGRARFEQSDLSALPAGPFDLVTASFLHSPVALAREDVLGRAAELVAPGGRLLITTHAAPPPWARGNHVHEHVFLTAEQELAQLGLDPATWRCELSEVREREATGPDGEHAMLQDGVVLLRREAV